MEQTLKLDKETAIKLYPDASAEFKEILEQSFGRQTFITDICERVKSIEDACRETGKQPSTNPDLYKRAEENIEIFAEAMRQGKPAGECFYYPYFSRSSGGGFSFLGYVNDNDYSIVGARLRVPDGKTATHMGKIMLVHYKIMDKG